MPGYSTQIRCLGCGLPRPAHMLRLDAETGAFNGHPHEPGALHQTFGGRGRLSVDHAPLPMHFALGLREALRAALARIEGDIIEAGGELPP